MSYYKALQTPHLTSSTINAVYFVMAAQFQLSLGMARGRSSDTWNGLAYLNIH